jgi:hypothetical protein
VSPKDGPTFIANNKTRVCHQSGAELHAVSVVEVNGSASNVTDWRAMARVESASVIRSGGASLNCTALTVDLCIGTVDLPRM